MKIEFCIDKLDSFLPQIAEQLCLEVYNDGFKIPSNQGQGYFTQKNICNDIVITYYDLFLLNEVNVIRKKSENDNIIPIVIWLSDSGIMQELEFEVKRIGKDTPNGIFLPSNSLETNYTFPKEVSIRNITILIKKDWLANLINEQNNSLNSVLFSNEQYFLYEEITYDIWKVLMQIEDLIKNTGNTLANIGLYASTMNLIYLIFEKIVNRSIDKQSLNINPQEIQRLFNVKSLLLKEYVSIPSTDYLAQEFGISQRKLQRLFKQVFGKSIYQFAMEIKMNEAKTLLISKKYSVSEVGYRVGYSNLSHFTQKFKEWFGVTPKSFLSSVS